MLWYGCTIWLGSWSKRVKNAFFPFHLDFNHMTRMCCQEIYYQERFEKAFDHVPVAVKVDYLHFPNTWRVSKSCVLASSWTDGSFGESSAEWGIVWSRKTGGKLPPYWLGKHQPTSATSTGSRIEITFRSKSSLVLWLMSVGISDLEKKHQPSQKIPQNRHIFMFTLTRPSSGQRMSLVHRKQRRKSWWHF